MKKYFIILNLILITILFSSCSKTDNYKFDDLTEDIVSCAEDISEIDKTKNEIAELKDKIKENKSDDQDINDRRQIAVAILEQSIEKLENADQISKNEIENDMKLALSIWESSVK